MGFKAAINEYKPHAVCVTCPGQGHMDPILKLAKLLHHKGFFITFVNTEHNHRCLLRSQGSAALDGLPDFRFASIPDGLPQSDPDVSQDIPSLCKSIPTTCLEPFCELLEKINSSARDVPPVSCIVSDGIMSFTVKAAERFGLPNVLFWTTSACGFLAYTQHKHLLERGYIPLKDIRQTTNGYLETIIDWVPGMKNMRLRDFPSFIRTTDSKDIMLNFFINEIDAVPRADALILNTFDDLELDSLKALSTMFPHIYTIGPLQLMMNYVTDKRLSVINSSLRRQDSHCIKWLDTKEPESIMYVNFGSSTVMTPQQMIEFAWGLANSKKPFLWIIRNNLIDGASAILPLEFIMETKDRSLLVSWCPQEEVLKHPAIGGFLTHSGWNSTLESIVAGVPMICWPFFAEQHTNCKYSCVEWKIGIEIDNDVKRDQVELMVKELMDGDKGKKMKENATNWKRKVEEATSHEGSSYMNLDKFINDVLLP